MNCNQERISVGVHKKLEAVKEQLAGVRLVLVRPKYGENVGAAARVAHNMGIRQLVVVADELPEQTAMAKLATHHAKELIDGLLQVPTLAEAVAPCSWVVGTTARQGRRRFFWKIRDTWWRTSCPSWPIIGWLWSLVRRIRA